MNVMLKKQWKRFQKSQTGAAMLMVLLVMVFVVIMGSSVMFTSYNSYMMRLVERAGVDNFYTTEELTDLVRVNVQEAASSALETSYTRVMAEYAFIQAECLYDDEKVQEAAQLKFNQYFVEELSKVTTTTSDGVVHMFQLDSSVDLPTEIAKDRPNITGSYSTNALEDMLPNVDGSAGVSGMTGHTSTDGTTGALTSESGIYFDNGTLTSGSGANAVPDTTNTSGGSAGNFYYTYGDDGYPRLVLEYVTVGYVTDGDSSSNTYGYETNITTDIIIEMPIFTHTGDTHLGFTGGGGTVTETNDDAIPFDGASSIGRYWVKHSMSREAMVRLGYISDTDEFLITGDLYGGTFYIFNTLTTAGKAEVDATDVKFSHGDGRLITKYGDVKVDPQLHGEGFNDHYVTASGLEQDGQYLSLDGIGVYGGTNLVTYEDSEIWTNSITVREGSDLLLSDDTKTYFAKDITISGGAESGTYYQTDHNVSNIALGGTIVGFNSGTTAATSSAITINGDNVVMDMSNLKSIILGGSAYLEIGRTITNVDGVENSYGEYKLGQSIAATPDALAYLVPTAALTASFDITSNPFMVSGTNSADAFDAVKIDRSHSSIPVPGMASMVNEKPQVISRQYKVDGEDYYLIYYFYDFISDSSRTTYLNTYNQNSGNFQNNLELFVDFEDGADLSGSSIQTDGIFYYLDTNGDLKMVNSNPDSSANLAEYDDDFYNASITLWPHMPPNNNYVATIYDHTYTGPTGEKYTKTRTAKTIAEYTSLNASNIMVDNPFDYYVNFHGDNLLVDTDYAGSHLDPADVDEDSIWLYFKDVQGTQVTDAYTRYGLEAWLRGKNMEGIHSTGVDRYDYIGGGLWGYEFYLGGMNGVIQYNADGVNGNYDDKIAYSDDKSNVVAIFTSVGCNLHDGKAPVGETTTKMHRGDIYLGDYPNLELVLTTAGANVLSNFKGLVFSETGIALNAPINSTELTNGFIEIMHSYVTVPVREADGTYTGDSETRYLYEFFRNLNMVGEYEDGNDGSGYLAPGVSEDDAKVNWKPNDLVYYENWEKY